MQAVTFHGSEVNLGRFGHVRSGDTLNLTDKEWSDVRGDKRFRPSNGTAAKPQVHQDSRADRLARANEATGHEELTQKTRDELFDIAKGMQRGGKIDQVPARATRQQLVKLIEEGTGVRRASAPDEPESGPADND